MHRHVPAKTGCYYDTIIVADAQSSRAWIALLVGVLHRLCRATNPLFDNLTLATWEKMMKEACRRLGFAQCFSPHQLRHGGASLDALEMVLDSRGIKHRGRWACTESVRRYMKHGVYLKTRAALADSDLRRARALQGPLLERFTAALKRWPQAPTSFKTG